MKLTDIFEVKKRDNGETFITLVQTHPHHKELQDWVRGAHNELFPNDYMCCDVLNTIKDVIEEDHAIGSDEFMDAVRERVLADNEVLYNNETREWMYKAHGDEWLDKRADDFGVTMIYDSGQSFMQIMEAGYLYHVDFIASSFPFEILKKEEESTQSI